MKMEQIKVLLDHQTQIISKIALETDLQSCLEDIVFHVESILCDPKAHASILVLESDQLFQGAAPNLPKAYLEQFNGLRIGESSAPCGTAAFTGEQVIVSDIENDPLWQSYAPLALQHQLRACWSTPIMSSKGEVLGTFAIYYSKLLSPQLYHLEIIQYFTQLTGIAIEKWEAHKQIERLAFYDVLTGLPNRRLLMDRTQRVIQCIKRKQQFGALIYIDLNGFKRINDSLGHYVGDELLIAVSHRLQDSIREIDTIARIGGDEFVVLIESLKESEDDIKLEAINLSNRILNGLEHHFELSGGRYKISASIGISLINQTDEDAIEILKHADAAMYAAKKDLNLDICFHNDALQRSIDLRLSIENEINTALDNMNFSAFYQPQLNERGQLISAEALIRWHHPKKGLVFPAEFITIAERMGVIHRMQKIVLTHICETLNILEKNQTLCDGFRISINICPSQLKSNSLPDTLMKTLTQYKISPNRIMLEITEGMLIDDMERSINILNRLRKLGFKISIDDFGTGYSSLAYLNRLPVNEVKIDRSFIETLTNEPCTQGVIDTVVSLSKHLNFDVIAEGIEEESQLEIMKTKKVKGFQGYLFAKPMNQGDFVHWVTEAA
ncbi:MAG: diguanylate cyclase (GGDEF)-like protein [Pseudohongiellaceae bacterium]|jgi:diguanylate cyclase (GGDEF)-like protein